MLRCKADVMRRILMEDACIVNRRKRQPYLWADKTWEKSLVLMHLLSYVDNRYSRTWCHRLLAHLGS